MVKNELNKLGLQYKNVELGEAEIINSISKEKLQLIDNALKDIGLELIEDRKSLLLEKVKTAVHEYIHSSEELYKTKISDYIKNKVNFDYSYLSKSFSNEQGITIEKYLIKTKIECVKNLLLNSELKLSDIAFKLHYSSVAHLSNQFKKITGCTPPLFGKIYKKRRNKKRECVNHVTKLKCYVTLSGINSPTFVL
jgi:YesN/AraC family two-component response regulator